VDLAVVEKGNSLSDNIESPNAGDLGIRKSHDNMVEKNVERQTRYKAARKNQSEFLAEPTPTGAWAAIELRQMERQLALLLTDFAEWEKEGKAPCRQRRLKKREHRGELYVDFIFR
jgi:hypothetical protein